MIGTNFGAYRILDKIGEGGMGQVYRARDVHLGRLVAIKVLPDTVADDADRLARFDREARVLASLNHPHIGAIYGREQSGDRVGLVLELVEGETLDERLSRRLSLPEATRLALHLIDALEAAHDRGIVHRDLKPANIKITSAGEIKVLDFGLARAVASGADDVDAGAASTIAVAHTEPGTILGTTAYMSPEQARGHDVDRRTDIWAFGCILYEMLTGRRAFDGGTLSDTMAAVLSREPDWSALPANVPVPVRQLLSRCLAKDPRQRLRDIADARFNLDASEADVQRPGMHVDARWLAIGLCLGLAAAAAALAVWRREAVPPSPPRTTFVIPPPSGSEWGGAPVVPYPSVSPDGRRLTFGGIGRDGTRLWIHDVETGVSTPVPGVPLLTAVAWAPDSNSFAYCRAGKLVRVNLVGAAPAELDAPGCSGRLSWGPNNRVLFASLSGIVQVDVASGGVQAVPLNDAATGIRLYPRWLPDGRHFAYLVRDVDPSRAGIYLTTLDGTPPVRLVPDVTAPVVVRGSDSRVWLLFVRQSTLVAQVIDVAARRMEGEARALATDIPIGLTVRAGAYDAAGTLLAYRSRSGGDPSELVWLDRRGRRLGVVDVSSPQQVSMSPDGSTLAVSRSNPDLNTFEVWQVDVARGGARPLIVAKNNPATPVWSPDGTGVAFLADEYPGWRPYRVTVGADPKPLLDAVSQFAFLTDWSSDGRWVLGAGGESRMLALDVNRRNVVSVGNGGEPMLSPDTRWLAFRSSESGTSEVYVRGFPDGRDVVRVSRGGGLKPTWRRDGRELYYRTSAGTMMAVAIGVRGSVLDAGEPVPLFTAPFVVGNNGLGLLDYAVTRDGERFVAVLAKDTSVRPLTVVRHWLP
jgi:Tol biopolymer transport system component